MVDTRAVAHDGFSDSVTYCKEGKMKIVVGYGGSDAAKRAAPARSRP
jgi:hypothetical protein